MVLSAENMQEVTAETAHLRMMPGISHTASAPFDIRPGYGWHRPNRAFCGALDYRHRVRAWSVAEHASFPPAVRTAVATMLCANNRPGCVVSWLPKELLLWMLEGALLWAWRRRRSRRGRRAGRAARRPSGPSLPPSLFLCWRLAFYGFQSFQIQLEAHGCP